MDTSNKPASATGAAVRHKEVSETHRLTRLELQPGGEVPAYHSRHGFVVYPLVHGTVRKTHYKDGKVSHHEDLTLDPKKPYYVPAFEAGHTVSVKNTGNTAVVCGKRMLPDESDTDQRFTF